MVARLTEFYGNADCELIVSATDYYQQYGY